MAYIHFKNNVRDMYLYTLIPIFSILGFSLFLNRKVNFDIKIAIPVSISVIIITLYLTTALGVLFYSTIFLYLAGLSSIAYLYKKDNEAFDIFRKDKSKIAVTSTIIFFLGLYFNNGYLSSWDDFSLWGIVTKELLIRHKFESLSDQTSIMSSFLHYPRGSSIFHYFMMLPVGFSEGAALFSHFILCLSFLLPIVRSEKFYESLFAIIVIFSISTLLSTSLRSLYNDILIGFMFSSVFIIFLDNKDNKNLFLSLFPILLAMPLVKEIGLINSLIATGIIYYQVTKDRNMPLFGTSNRHFILMIIFISPLILSLLHSTYFVYLHSNIDRKQHSFSNIIDVLSNFSLDSLYQIFHFTKLLVFNFVKEGAIAIYLSIYITYLYTKKHNIVLNIAFLKIFKLLLIGFSLFILWRLYINIFIFNYITNSSLVRYLSSYDIIFLVISLYYLIQVFPSNGLIPNHRLNQTDDFNGEASGAYLGVDEHDESSKKHLDHLKMGIGMKRNEKLGLAASATFVVVVLFQALDRIPTFLSLEEEVYHNQIAEVRDYIKSGKEIEISYQGKPGRQECHELAFRMSPYLNNEQIEKCIASPSQKMNVYLGTIKKIPENNDANCKVVYKPFLLDYSIKCSE